MRVIHRILYEDINKISGTPEERGEALYTLSRLDRFYNLGAWPVALRRLVAGKVDLDDPTISVRDDPDNVRIEFVSVVAAYG